MERSTIQQSQQNQLKSFANENNKLQLQIIELTRQLKNNKFPNDEKYSIYFSNTTTPEEIAQNLKTSSQEKRKEFMEQYTIISTIEHKMRLVMMFLGDMH